MRRSHPTQVDIQSTSPIVYSLNDVSDHDHLPESGRDLMRLGGKSTLEAASRGSECQRWRPTQSGVCSGCV